MGKLRAGELVALAGIVCVIVSLFEPWYEGPAGTSTCGTPSVRPGRCCWPRWRRRWQWSRPR